MNHQFQPSRRGLFKGIVQKAQGKPVVLSVIRPPGALNEADFIDVCTRCNACVETCEENIIVRGDGGFPELSFKDRGCTGCKDCLDACEPKALLNGANLWPLGQLVLKDNCLAKNNVTCQSCKDACDVLAITFPMTAATPKPQINTDLCTGCGECVSVCPVDSISIEPVANLERENA
jgi:ferredoxin-type protein NapF